MISSSYNSVNHSPEDFFNKFIEVYKFWNENGFHSISGVDPRKKWQSFSETVMYSGGKRNGAIIESYAKVKVCAFSRVRTYSDIKKEEIGSVIVTAFEEKNRDEAIHDLEKITGISLGFHADIKK